MVRCRCSMQGPQVLAAAGGTSVVVADIAWHTSVQLKLGQRTTGVRGERGESSNALLRTVSVVSPLLKRAIASRTVACHENGICWQLAGPKVRIVAPGENIYSTWFYKNSPAVTNGAAFLSGTSMVGVQLTCRPALTACLAGCSLRLLVACC